MAAVLPRGAGARGSAGAFVSCVGPWRGGPGVPSRLFGAIAVSPGVVAPSRGPIAGSRRVIPGPRGVIPVARGVIRSWGALAGAKVIGGAALAQTARPPVERFLDVVWRLRGGKLGMQGHVTLAGVDAQQRAGEHRELFGLPKLVVSAPGLESAHPVDVLAAINALRPILWKLRDGEVVTREQVFEMLDVAVDRCRDTTDRGEVGGAASLLFELEVVEKYQPQLLESVLVEAEKDAPALDGLIRARLASLGVVRVIDIDTLDVAGVRIRLLGIDAPESGQTCPCADGLPYACGQAASATPAGAVGLGQVRCYRYDTDHYGRTVAKGWVGTDSLTAAMVVIGWAMAYRDYSMDYVDEETFAQRGRLGMWTGRFDAPWDWRRPR